MPKQRPIDTRITETEEHLALLKQIKRAEVERNKLQSMKRSQRRPRRRAKTS